MLETPRAYCGQLTVSMVTAIHLPITFRYLSYFPGEHWHWSLYCQVTRCSYPKYVKQRPSLALFMHVKVLQFWGGGVSAGSLTPFPLLCSTHFGGLHTGGLLSSFYTVALCLAHIYVFGCLRGGIVLGWTV